MKVMTLVGTRPELIRLSRTIPALDDTFDHILVHTGQNFDPQLNQVFFDQLKIRKPDFYLEAAKSSPAQTIASVIEKTDAIIEKEQPDAFVVLGDTNSALGAISAKRRKVPIFHIEAGNRAFDQRVPEEVNRKVVDHLSDINITYSQIAREYLIREDFPADRVFCLGSPLKEVIDFYRKDWEKSSVLGDLGLDPKNYFVLSVHREENVDSERKLTDLINTLKLIEEKYPSKKVVFSIHPRTQNRLAGLQEQLPKNVLASRPFGYFEYLKLQNSAYAVLSDSGTVTEEASILGVPAINLRDTHERPEGVTEAVALLTSLSPKELEAGLAVMERQIAGTFKAVLVKDYAVDNFSEKMVRTIQSYTHFVNRYVWRKFL